MLAFAAAWFLSLAPLPFSLLSGVAAIVCAVLLIRSMILGAKTERRTRTYVTGVVGLLACLALIAMATLSAVFYQPMKAVQDCQSSALTEQAKKACADSLQDEVMKWLSGK